MIFIIFFYVIIFLVITMKLIGIVGRAYYNKDNQSIIQTHDAVRKAIVDNDDCVCITLLPTENINYLDVVNGKDIVNKEKIDYVLDKCDGFIVPGGTYFYHFDEYVIDYAIRNDKPLLCICLGFQALCSMFAKDRTKFDMTIEDSTNSHKGEPDKYFHDVVVSNKLKDIFGTDRLMVNSVHHDLVKFEMNELVINAKCGDVIEGVEYPNKKFIIGVQWHPEYLMDDNSKKLLNEFIKNTK